MASDVLDLFLELAALPSPSGEERAVADRVLDYLRDCGLAARRGRHRAARSARRWATSTSRSSRPPTASRSSSAPTSTPCRRSTAIEPVVEDGIVRNRNQAILGGDNKAAVAAMLEAARRVLAEGRPHAGIELVFTSKEEVGLLGAYAFDHTRLRARTGFVYDEAAPIGCVILGAPSAQLLEVDVPRPGRARGHVPRGGPLGDRRRRARDLGDAARADRRGDDRERRHDRGRHRRERRPRPVLASSPRPAPTTSASSQTQVQAMQDALSFAAGVADCEVETTISPELQRLPVLARRPAGAARRRGARPLRLRAALPLSGGAADANVFNERGLHCVNLANGMAEIHTPDEHIAVADVEAMVEVTLALIDAAAAA